MISFFNKSSEAYSKVMYGADSLHGTTINLVFLCNLFKISPISGSCRSWNQTKHPDDSPLGLELYREPMREAESLIHIILISFLSLSVP